MATWIPWTVAGVSVLCLLVAAELAREVLGTDPGSERMREISREIQLGAVRFLGEEYKVVLPFIAALAALVALTLYRGWMVMLCFLLGGACSAGAAYVGLAITTRANSRTTEQACLDNMALALKIAYRGGLVMGLAVTGGTLLGIAVCYLVFQVILGLRDSSSIILGFALGSAAVALFTRVGGGIFTKGADVGADLAGKVEEGIPEDDPRNPAVIADNVGDNVGDVAGMGADLSSSLAAATLAPIAIAGGGVVYQKLGASGMLLPLAIAAAGILCSIAGTFFVAFSTGRKPERSLLFAIGGAAALTTGAAFFVTWGILGWKYVGMFWPLLAGIVAGLGIGATSEYFTSSSYAPVKRMARASTTGAGTTVIRGLSEGMTSTVIAVVLIAAAVGLAFHAGNSVFAGGGIYGVSLLAIGVLGTAGMAVSVDAYGSVSDNAGGIAEMADLSDDVRARTDLLDSAGNTMAAISKGFSIGAAALAAIALLTAYAQATGLSAINLINDKTIVGLLLGVMAPLAFSAHTMRAVERAASAVVDEVRRQFRDIPGLREGREGVRPDYSAAVGMTARAAVYEMIVPAVLAVAVPLLIGRLLGMETLAGFIAGAIASGFAQAVWMVNAGEAWDNAKKYIEAGNLGGKGTPAHAAAVVGDTVGDPLKDTAGPSLNVLIVVMAVVAVLFVPLFSG
ncbi:MAG: sodium-translocating pyrophosphatase [Candidatus Geothermincolia bacterium]